MAGNISNDCPFESIHTDCFAVQVNGRCFTLHDTSFGTETCPFYKPERRVSPNVIVEKKKVDAVLEHVASKKKSR